MDASAGPLWPWIRRALRRTRDAGSSGLRLRFSQRGSADSGAGDSLAMKLACWFVMLALPVRGAEKSPAKILLQMEREWSQAGISKDSKTMDRIMADDWVSVDFQGRTVTKA